MSEERRHWILKVISGPHQGAEIRLPSGRSLVGSDDACDVMLHDVLVAPQHFSLDLSVDSIKVSPLGGKVYCDGKRIKEGERKVDPFAFLTAGGTHLIVGPSDQKWPSFSISDIPEIEKEEESEGGKDAAKGKEEPSPVADQPAEGKKAKAKEERVEDGERKTEAPADRRGRALVGVGFGLFLLLLWLVVIYRFKSPAEVQEGTGTPVAAKEPVIGEDKVSEVGDFVKTMSYGKELKVEPLGGVLQVTGYVETDEQLRQLREELKGKFESVFSRVRSLEAIESGANAVIVGEGLDLLAEVQPDGQVNVSGTIPREKAASWEKAKRQLAEIPGVSFEKIADKVRVEAPPKVAAVEKDTPGNDAEEKPPIGLRVVSATDRSADGAGSLMTVPGFGVKDPSATVEVIGIRNDGLNWVRMKNGSVYFKGARLPTGGIIETIEPGAVVIVEDSRERRVSQGEQAWDPSKARP